MEDRVITDFLKSIGVLPIGASNNAYRRAGQPMRHKLTFQRRRRKIKRLISRPLKHRQRVKIKELKRAYAQYILGHEDNLKAILQQER